MAVGPGFALCVRKKQVFHPNHSSCFRSSLCLAALLQNNPQSRCAGEMLAETGERDEAVASRGFFQARPEMKCSAHLTSMKRCHDKT